MVRQPWCTNWEYIGNSTEWYLEISAVQLNFNWLGIRQEKKTFGVGTSTFSINQLIQAGNHEKIEAYSTGSLTNSLSLNLPSYENVNFPRVSFPLGGNVQTKMILICWNQIKFRFVPQNYTIDWTEIVTCTRNWIGTVSLGLLVKLLYLPSSRSRVYVALPVESCR